MIYRSHFKEPFPLRHLNCLLAAAAATTLIFIQWIQLETKTYLYIHILYLVVTCQLALLILRYKGLDVFLHSSIGTAPIWLNSVVQLILHIHYRYTLAGYIHTRMSIARGIVVFLFISICV